KTHGNFRGPRDCSEREAAFHAQAPESMAGRLAGISGSSDYSLFLQDVYNRGRIEAASAAKEKSPLQQTDVGFCVHAVAADGALRRDEAEGFPGSQSRRRNAETASDFRDAQETLGR